MEQYLREGVAAFLSVVILAGAAFFLMDTYIVAKTALDPAGIAAFSRQKDILQVAVTLLGTVTGYYLGRVPAERRAQQAERREASALTSALAEEERNIALRSSVHSQILGLRHAFESSEAGASIKEKLDRLLSEVQVGGRTKPGDP